MYYQFLYDTIYYAVLRQNSQYLVHDSAPRVNGNYCTYQEIFEAHAHWVQSTFAHASSLPTEFVQFEHYVRDRSTLMLFAAICDTQDFPIDTRALSPGRRPFSQSWSVLIPYVIGLTFACLIVQSTAVLIPEEYDEGSFQEPGFFS